MENERKGIIGRMLGKISGEHQLSARLSNPVIEEMAVFGEEKARFRRADSLFQRIEEQRDSLKSQLSDIQQVTQQPKLLDIPPEFGDKLPPHP